MKVYIAGKITGDIAYRENSGKRKGSWRKEG